MIKIKFIVFNECSCCTFKLQYNLPHENLNSLKEGSTFKIKLAQIGREGKHSPVGG